MLGLIGLLYFYFNSNLSLAKYFNSNFMIKHKFWILEYQSLIWKSQLLLNQLSYDPNKIMWQPVFIIGGISNSLLLQSNMFLDCYCILNYYTSLKFP